MTNFLAKSPVAPSLHRQTKSLAIAISLAFTSFSASAAGPGHLDATFGQANDGTPDGVASFSLGAGNDYGKAVAVQADGKIVVVGHTTSTGGKSSNIAVQRLLADGQLDKTFGADGGKDGTPDGVVSLDLGESSDLGVAVVVQPDGKIVLAGNSKAQSSNIVLARLTSAGQLDKSFGADDGKDGTPDGVVSVSLGDGDDVAAGLALQKDGKLVVVGHTASTGKTSNIAVARLTSAGMLDKLFGADGGKDSTPDGVVSLDLGESSDLGVAVVVQADGKIVLAGNSKAQSSNIVLARLTSAGQLDKSFGADDGKDGTPDGVVSVSLGDGDDVAAGLALQKDGKIVVVGHTASTGKTSNIAVARLTSAGMLDKLFGTDGGKDGTPDGVVSLDLGESNDLGVAVVVKADGKIVLAGNSKAKSSNMVLARLTSAGQLDKSFGADDGKDGTPDGVVSVSLGDGDDVAAGLALQKDGKLVVVGDRVNGGSADMVVLRVLNH